MSGKNCDIDDIVSWVYTIMFDFGACGSPPPRVTLLHSILARDVFLLSGGQPRALQLH